MKTSNFPEYVMENIGGFWFNPQNGNRWYFYPPSPKNKNNPLIIRQKSADNSPTIFSYSILHNKGTVSIIIDGKQFKILSLTEKIFCFQAFDEDSLSLHREVFFDE